MRERAEAFGGQLHVRSTPNQGTIVEVTIPFTNEDEKQSGKEGA
jgi:nitrate/nitrite-specific signal transduction histidine kinase